MTEPARSADLLLVNANVLTMDPAQPRARAVAVTGERITGLPDDPARVRAAQVVDVRGATLLPGFHDAHNHMAWYGQSLSEADLRPVTVPTLDGLYAAVARQAEQTPPGGWVMGQGYDQNKFGRHPHRDALDQAAPGRRVWLRHTTGHMGVASSLVLADLGLDTEAPAVDGGRVATDPDGRPNGLLEERAMELVGDLLFPAPLGGLAQAIARAAERYVSEGITSVTEAGIGGGWIGRSPVELAAYQLVRDQGRLPVRVELMVAGNVLHPLNAHASDGLDLGLDLGLRTGFGDDWLRLGAVKIFSDGSLLGHTAAMYEDFADTPGESGYLQADAAELTRLIISAHRSGWQVATHAIGDRAIDVTLNAYDQALATYPRRDPRHRIEHFCVSRPDQVRRAAKLGIIAVPQGRFATEIGDSMLATLGPRRSRWLYRHRSLLDAGLVLPGSSDRPVAAGAPLLGIHDMVNRRTGSGAEYNPDEAITAEQALRAYTYGSAYASHAEDRKGSITPGKLADLVLLSEDPTAVSPDRIGGLEVLATFAGGQCRFHNGALGDLP